ncbi:MAG: ComEC/Rec2 family competence protein [Flavobacteriaceae bacterium]
MKKLLLYHPLHFLVFLIVGIVIQFYTNLWTFGFLNLGITITVLLLNLIAFKVLKKALLFSFTSFLLWFFVGVSSVFIQTESNYKNYYTKHNKESSTYLVKIYEVLKPGNYYHKYKIKVLQTDSVKTRGKLLLNLQKDSLKAILTVDDVIVLKPELKELIPPLNPHQFNYKDYLAKQGIHQQVFINNKQFQKINNSTVSLFGLSAKFRNKIQQSLLKYNFSKNEFGVINALLLGQRQDISKELINNYAKAGAIHILAVSGLHIGIILLILSAIFKPLERVKNGKFLKLFLIVLLLWMYAFIAGLSASVVRAVTMFTFVAVGSVSNRKNNVYFSLITSMFFLLLVNPMFLFDVGFQLSYLAVFGIVWVQPKLYNLCKPKFLIFDKLWQLFTVSIAAQVGILPVSLYYFHQFPSLFILSNLVIIPFLGVILMCGILIIVLSIFKLLPQFLADTYEYIIYSMNKFVSWIANQEDFLFKELSVSFLLMFALYFLVFSGVYFLTKRKNKPLLLFLVSVITIQSVFMFEKYQRDSVNELVVFHKSRTSILAERKGNMLSVFHEMDSVKIRKQKLLISYKLGENVGLKFSSHFYNMYQTKNNKLLVIDSLGIYQNLKLNQPIVLLRHSPKINLKRLIKELKPKQVIADGSNYKSYVNRWEVTCEKEKTPFHYTGQNEAYIIK